MKVHKAARFFLVFLISIIGLVILLFLSLNLPFTNNFVTNRTNQVLRQANLPIQIHKIKRILPNSIKIQGILIADLSGDTIIHVGELQTNCRLLALVRKKVVLQDLELNQSRVELLMNYKTQEYNIAEAFTSGRKPEVANEGDGKANWVITVNRGKLFSTHFQMTDSVSGIHILQDISEAGLKKFTLSLQDREIIANTLKLDHVAGNVTLGSIQGVENSEKGEPWNFGLLNLSLKDINFTYGKGSEGVILEMVLGEGNIRANEMNMLHKVVDVKSISLARTTAILHTSGQSQKPKVQPEGSNVTFPWNLKGHLIDLEDINISLKNDDVSVYNVTGLQMKLKDFRIGQDHTGVEFDRFGFDMDNGFTLKEFKGDLDSDSETTKLKLSLETGNSHLLLEVLAQGSLWGIVSNPRELEQANLSFNKTTLSLKDMACFIPVLADQAGFTTLARQPFSIAGNIGIVKSVFNFSGITISQDQNFHIAMDGKAEDPFEFSNARGNMDLGISDMNMAWMNEMLTGFGMKDGLPESITLSLKGNISGPMNSPDFNLRLMSNVGNIDGSGSVNFETDSFSVHSSFKRVLLGDILKNPELGSFTGSAEVSGMGFSLETLHSNILLLVDSLRFHDYTYTHASIEGALRPGAYDFRVQVNDSCFRADLHAILNPADSIFVAKATGTVFAQLDKLHLLKDTFSVKTHLSANLIKSRNSLETDFSLNDIVLANSRDSADIKQISAFFGTDSLFTTLKAEADFLRVDLKVAYPFSELDAISRGYGNYLSTYTNPNHVHASSRVLELPEINATGNIIYHDAMGLLFQDTSFQFIDLDFSILSKTSDQRINYIIKGSDIEYKGIRIGNLETTISDSGGTTSLHLLADNNSINSSPANKVELNSRISGWQSTTELAIHGKKDEIIYDFEISSALDSNDLVFQVPSKQLIMNREQWQMDTPSLLSVNLETGKISPELKMHTDTSFFHLFSESKEGLLSFKGELNQVAISSIIQEGLISGKPTGSISGSIEYSMKGDIEQQLISDLQFSDVGWSGLEFSNIDLNGTFKVDTFKSYSIDMSALLDSSKIAVKGNKIYDGAGTIHADFSEVPIYTFEPFVKKHLSDLGGTLSGNFNISSSEAQENFFGEIYLTDGKVRINTLNSQFRIPRDSVRFSGQKVIFNKFRVVDSLNNELLVDGFIDLSNRLSVTTDMEISSSKLQVMNRSESEDVPLYGQIFVDSRLSVKGPVAKPTINGKILLSKGTDIYYRYMEDLSLSETQKIVSFVDHSMPDIPNSKLLIHGSNTMRNSSIETLVEIDPTTRINFKLDKRIYNIDIMITGGGSLNYHMLNNNQVALMGTYEISDGSADVKLIGWPNKDFRIAKGGFIRWEGPVDNPELRFEALNKVSSSYTNPVDGKQRNVDFNVILKLSNTLSDLDVLFTISTTDQYLMSIINTMSPEEQMRQAITILLFEYIDLPGITTSSNYMSQQVNQLLASQLNQLAKTTIQGVDISFGIDTYVQASETGAEETKTSLSYEVRKNFLDNRAQIEFSGRLNDLTQQQGATDFSLNNLSFEYRLDSAASKYIIVYSEHSYEDVFTGEIVKTGVGFTYRKRYKHIRDIWRRKKIEKTPKTRGR